MTDPNNKFQILEVEVARLDERTKAQQLALKLQATEYERRLDMLNHAHQKAVEVQHTYVTVDKYEDKLHSEAQAREIALSRMDEKFEDYVKRYEQRQREVDLLLAAQKGATSQATRAAETTQYKANRNIAISGVLLAGIVILMNVVDKT